MMTEPTDAMVGQAVLKMKRTKYAGAFICLDAELADEEVAALACAVIPLVRAESAEQIQQLSISGYQEGFDDGVGESAERIAELESALDLIEMLDTAWTVGSDANLEAARSIARLEAARSIARETLNRSKTDDAG